MLTLDVALQKLAEALLLNISNPDNRAQNSRRRAFSIQWKENAEIPKDFAEYYSRNTKSYIYEAVDITECELSEQSNDYIAQLGSSQTDSWNH